MSGNAHSNAYLWKNLWKLKLPTKIKIFSWRACVDGLLVYVKMVERGIKFDFNCPVRGEEPESLIHALVSLTLLSRCGRFGKTAH